MSYRYRRAVTVSSTVSPSGRRYTAVSPTAFFKSAAPMGERHEMSPLAASVSSTPTMRQVWVWPS